MLKGDSRIDDYPEFKNNSIQYKIRSCYAQKLKNIEIFNIYNDTNVKQTKILMNGNKMA